MLKQILCLVALYNCFAYTTIAQTYTWTGNQSTAWADTGNWNPVGIPDSSSSVIITSGNNICVLDQSRNIENLVVEDGVLDLNSYILSIPSGTAAFTGGEVITGKIEGYGESVIFSGGIINSEVNFSCAMVELNGGTFNGPVEIEVKGTSSSGNHNSGGCVFNNSLSITLASTAETGLWLATESGNEFNGPTTFISNSVFDFSISHYGTTNINADVTLQLYGSGYIIFGNVTSPSSSDTYLAEGYRLFIENHGDDYSGASFVNFYQIGSESLEWNITGFFILNFIESAFHGELNINVSEILLSGNIFDGPVTINKIGDLECNWDGGNTFNAQVTINNNGDAALNIGSRNGDTFNGDLYLSTSSNKMTLANTGNNYFAGNITVFDSDVSFHSSDGKVIFIGNENQALSHPDNYFFRNLEINKSSGNVLLDAPAFISNELIFVTGKIISDSINMLTFNPGSYVTGASDAGFVEGPLKKIGNTAFVFPVGKNSNFSPIGISTPDSMNNAFVAEYFDHEQGSGTNKDSTINFISDCAYWNLIRTAGTSAVIPKFDFDSTRCDYLKVKPAHITFWNGNKWVDLEEAVIDGQFGKTNNAVDDFGSFALAYMLTPGDAPQMPINLGVTTVCSHFEMLFNNPDTWFSISPDSALLNIGIFTPDTAKRYAPVKSGKVYEAYNAGNVLIPVDSIVFECDSLWNYSKVFSASLDTSKQYLLRFSRYLPGDCPGIIDSIDHYLNICITNLRMNVNPIILCYNDANDLLGLLGSVGSTGIASFGDIIAPCSSNLEIDFNQISGNLPLVVRNGRILTGDYDLLSEVINFANPVSSLNYTNTNSSPEGTIIHYAGRGTMVANSLSNDGYLLFLEDDAAIYNLRIKGALGGFQDYNEDDRLCAAVKIINDTPPVLSNYAIRNCEIYNFSYSGIFADAKTDDIQIERSLIHRVRGSGGGDTNPKGYGIWLQGNNTGSFTGTNSTITNCIIDECKTAIDLQSHPLNLNISGNTFGSFFNQETINRHNETTLYNHPGTGTLCDYYIGSTPNSITSGFAIADNAAGDITITSSIFYKKKQVISIPYPVKVGSPSQLYNIKISDNTFKSIQDPPNTFIPADDNYGGYARISDNYIESCTWDYERVTNSTNGPIIVINSPNFHNYQPGSNVTGGCASCPQPPSPEMQITDYSGTVRGFSQSTPVIPFINEGDDFGLTIQNPGSSNPVVFIIRAHPNNNASVTPGDNVSGNNSFDNAQYISAPGTTPVDIEFGPSAQMIFDTDKPGLYGIDAIAVSGNTSPYDYYASDLIHKPIIITPSDNHQLIFNIKDSYYADLYDAPLLASGLIFKQAELNGHVIWQEDVTEGGDDWEQVVIDLMDGLSPTYFNTLDPKNTLTFSIAIPDPSLVDVTSLRGLMVWVDDVYLKRFNSAENLIRDGDMENSPEGGLSNNPTSDKPWYFKNQIAFTSCWTLDKPQSSQALAKSESTVGALDRKSGLKSILLKLDGLHAVSTCVDYDDYTYVGTPPISNEVISAAVDFDYRDFVGCDAYSTSGPLPGFIMLYNIAVVSGVNTLTEDNLIIDENIHVESGETLKLDGCLIVVKPHNPPWKIIVEDGGTLEINNSGAARSRLFACGDMWGGIENQGGTVKVRPGSGSPTEIKDALVAIDSDEGIVNVRYAEFDHNYIGIRLRNGDFRPGGFSVNDGLLGIDFKCTGGKIEKQPWAGEPSHAHIVLENVTEVNVGGVGNATSAYTNTFSDAVYGIKATNSSAIIRNNSFSNIINYSDVHPCPTCGSGIFAVNSSSAPQIVTIGGDLTVEPFWRNTFEISRGGVYTNGNINVTIQGNRLEGLKEGIRINHNNADVLINLENEFEEVSFGIIGRTVIGNFSIDNNSFTSAPSPGTTLSHFENTAITIQNPLSSILSGQESITNNEISDYRIGIHAANMPGIEVGGWDGSNSLGNIIEYNLTQFPLGFFHAGIWLQSCTEAKVVKNEITNSTFNDDNRFRGIDIESSPDCDINCNTIEKTGIALNFYANCNLTKLRENIFNQYGTGIMLNGPNGASINADQGGINDAWDNEWNPDGSSNFDVDGQVLTGGQINWFHQDIDDPDPIYIYSPNPWNGNIINPKENETSGNPTCDDFSRIAVNRIANFGSIVGDSANYGTDSIATRYQSRLEAYRAMKNDTTITYQFDSLDTAYINFITILDTGNVGRFNQVTELATIYPDSADYLNSLITPVGETETLLKAFLSLYFDKLLTGDTLSPADSSDLHYLTQLSRSAYGEMVHNAGAALFYEIHPDEASSRMGLISSNNNSLSDEFHSSNYIIIYPNPARERISVILSEETKWIEVYNSYGSRIMMIPLLDRVVNIETNNLMTGLYYVKAILQSGDIVTSKFILQ